MLLRCVDQAADTVVHVAATSAALLVEHPPAHPCALFLCFPGHSGCTGFGSSGWQLQGVSQCHVVLAAPQPCIRGLVAQLFVIQLGRPIHHPPHTHV